jgi:hypothetical protein
MGGPSEMENPMATLKADDFDAAVKAAQPQPKGCKLGLAIDAIEPGPFKDRVLFYMADLEVNHQVFATALQTSTGITVSRFIAGNHRRRQCPCPEGFGW